MSKFGFKTYSASLKYEAVLKKGEVLEVEAALFLCGKSVWILAECHEK